MTIREHHKRKGVMMLSGITIGTNTVSPVRRVARVATKRETYPVWLMWATCLILTFVYSDLSWRSLLAAFFSWVGGIITAELNDQYHIVNKIMTMLKREHIRGR